GGRPHAPVHRRRGPDGEKSRQLQGPVTSFASAQQPERNSTMSNWRQRLLLLAGIAGVVAGMGFWPRGEPTQARSPLGGPAAQHHVQWPSAKNPIWSFYWVAPPDSTNPHGSYSGLELRHVFYKGKRVFWQANTPVVNVHYDRG